jgi:hypothetical protein
LLTSVLAEVRRKPAEAIAIGCFRRFRLLPASSGESGRKKDKENELFSYLSLSYFRFSRVSGGRPMTTQALITPVPQPPSPQPLKAPLKSLTYDQLRELVANAPGDIVSGLVPEQSVNIWAGDSGLGKSALLIQLGLCVAAGLPFLGQEVRPGPNKVLLVDLENSQAALNGLIDTISGYLGLPHPPEDFRILSFPDAPDVEREILAFRPALVIIDALRGFNPEAEEKNSVSGKMLSQLHKLAVRIKAAIIFVHHLRKEDRKNPAAGTLVATPVMDWLQEVSGARALVNQTDVRVGIEAQSIGETEIVLKGHYKLSGEFGPWHIGRVYGDEGEPLGYRRLRGFELLSQEHRDAYKKLESESTYTQARKAFGKGGRPLTTFLSNCFGAGILEKHGAGKKARYRKVEISESEAAKPADAAKIIAYCSNGEPDKVYRDADFQGVTGLKGAALAEVIAKLQTERRLTPSPNCKGCYQFVDESAVESYDEPSSEARA